MTVTTYFTADADLLHDIGTSPNGRESLAWVAPLPDEQLALFFYAWRHADTEKWGHLVAIGQPDVRVPLLYDLVDGLDLDGEQLDDCAVGRLKIRQPEPLRVCELSYVKDDIAMDVRFEALHEPFSWHQNDGGCPVWAAADRYEQSMRTSGTVRIGDRVVDFEGFAHRDHSWGTRDWRALQHWKWMNASALDGSVSLHAWEALAYADRSVLGYVNRGGVVSPIRAIRAVADLDDRLIHRAIAVDIEDEDGGTVRFEAQLAAGVVVPIAQLYMHEIAMTATIDGAPAVAHVEFGWLQSYADAARRDTP